ncbi:MAG: S-layer homology domain-containing protein [Clostridiales bacterium]|nr:S-layer homology domain-containing protein [Clostridiales bacterium]
MKLKKLITAILAAAMLLGNTAFAADMYATRGEVADMLLLAADDYNPTVQKSDIIKGYDDGELHEDLSVTRAEAIVMLGRAFGKLPMPTGHNARVALPQESFTDIPDWAKTELKDVFDAGIAAGTAEGIFSPNDNVTKEQMKLFIQRVYALYGTNEKDDFYASVNRDALNTLEIKPGRVLAGTLFDLQDESTAQVNEIIKEATSGKWEKGTKEQKIADFYNNILDIESRNKSGAAPIKPYLEMIDKANNVTELMNTQNTLMEKLYCAPFAAFNITVDFKDSTRYIPVFGVYNPNMTKDFYISGTEVQKAAYLKYLKTVMELSGEEITDLGLEKFHDFEKSLAEKMLNTEDMGNVDKFYNIYTLDEIQTLFPSVDTEKLLVSSGIQKEDKFLITDVGLTEEFARFLSDENIEVLKIAVKLCVILNYGSMLNTEFIDTSNVFNQEYLGVSGTYSDEERAAIIVSSVMPDYIGEIYAEKYFTEEAKQDVLKMVNDIISVYKKRIGNLTWMSDETKEKAIRKLNAMKIKIGYPDNWDTYLDDVYIKSASEGGSYFENMLAVGEASKKELSKLQGKPVDKSEWAMYPYTVNACYSDTSNDITFPAAILQPPMYDVNASYEENLGSIGYIIAHEITHAFDNNGAKFDENGNAADWWAQKDYDAFERLCEKMVSFYDGIESVPGISMNGKLTLSENVADQGAVQCITEVVSGLENPDYKALYRSMARAWASTRTREYAKYAASVDLHSDEKLRVNRVVVNCEEFYEAFDIKEGDGMYVPEDERVKIW